MTTKRCNFRCRLQLNKDCPESHFVKYFQDQGTQQKNESILKAMKAFWLPLAIESTEAYSSSQVVKFYLDAIEQLKEQIWYLQQLVRVNHHVELGGFNLVSSPQENNLMTLDLGALKLLEEEEEEEEDENRDFLTDSTRDYNRSNFGF